MKLAILEGVLFGLFLLLSVFLGLTLVRLIAGNEGALPQVYKGYNHIRIYEDGSYEGETVEGVPEVGCISGALCED